MTPEDRSAIAQEAAAMVLGALIPLFQAQAHAFTLQAAKIDHMHTSIPNIDGMMGDIVTILRELTNRSAPQDDRPRPNLSVVALRQSQPDENAPQPA